jgi:excisionase family DNA binding protein
MADDDEILLVSQVATEFAVTEQTVRAWLHSGKLKGRRVGKAYRILRSDVLAMLEAAPPVGPEAGLADRGHSLAAADTRGEVAARSVVAATGRRVPCGVDPPSLA